MKKKQTNIWNKVLILFIFLFVIFTFTSCAALFVGGGNLETGSVAIIPVSGVIVSSGDDFGQVASADTIVELIRQANDNPAVEAIVLEINSPGGSPVGSDEIGAAILGVEKPVVAWIRESAASGAYWIASASDHIIANRMSVTGSIGVVGNYFGLEEFLEEYNVSYRRFVSGERKDLGTPFREMTEEESAFLQQKIDAIHWYFVDEVARNRNLSFEYVDGLATGEFYLGFEAYEAGLVDELGGYSQVVAYLEGEGVTVDAFRLEPEKGLFDGLFDISVELNSPTVTSSIQT